MASSAPAVAQSTGSIRGTVFDVARGRLIAGAEVNIISPATKETTKSDRNGYFAFWSVPPGPVRVYANAPGFAPVSFTACVHADVFEYFRVQLPDRGGTWAAILGHDLNKQGHWPVAGITSDLYSLGDC